MAFDSVDHSISVVLPLKNGVAFLGEALESMRLSKVRPLEVLVVDAASVDGGRELAQAWPGVRVVSQTTGNLADALNLGISEARGEIVAFFAADDMWTPGSLDMRLEVLRRDPALLISGGLVEHVLEGTSPPPGFRLELLDGPGRWLLPEAVLIRREAFEQIGLFDTALSPNMDTDWFCRAQDAGLAVGWASEVVLRRRVHGANQTYNNPEMTGNMMSILRSSVGRKRSSALVD